MSRWSSFRDVKEDIPTDGFEAVSFLNNSYHHIRNLGRSREASDACRLIIEAMRRVNTSGEAVSA